MIDNMYTPDREEMDLAINFIRSCSGEDLKMAWNKSSEEWDARSLFELHRAIISAGRINELVDAIIINMNKREG
jgi:hypothetical protein